MAEAEKWDRTRASIIPITIVPAFYFLANNWNTECLWMIIPGAIMGIYIKFKTKAKEGPNWLMNCFGILSFLMSVMWIKFASDSIMDLLKLFGYVSELPASLFGLTILAWGNCLGDAIANLAMTKKGYGEMAITASLAGPIFNVLIGLGLSMFIKFLSMDDPYSKAKFSLYKTNGTFDPVSVLPLTLIIA